MQGIGVAEYVKACQEGLKVGPTFCLPIGIVGLQSKCTTAKQMNLEQLKSVHSKSTCSSVLNCTYLGKKRLLTLRLRHHDVLIEHDGSLAHQDTHFGKNFVVNKRSYEMFLGAYPKGAKYTSLKTASVAKFARVNDSLTNNPNVNYGARGMSTSSETTRLCVHR